MPEKKSPSECISYNRIAELRTQWLRDQKDSERIAGGIHALNFSPVVAAHSSDWATIR